VEPGDDQDLVAPFLDHLVDLGVPLPPGLVPFLHRAAVSIDAVEDGVRAHHHPVVHREVHLNLGVVEDRDEGVVAAIPREEGSPREPFEHRLSQPRSRRQAEDPLHRPRRHARPANPGALRDRALVLLRHRPRSISPQRAAGRATASRNTHRSASIAEAGLNQADTAIAIAAFIALGSVTVADAVLFYLLDADRAARPLAAVKQFMSDYNAVIMMVVLLLLGAKLLGDGLSVL
jgi:hypothetical protein